MKFVYMYRIHTCVRTHAQTYIHYIPLHTLHYSKLHYITCIHTYMGMYLWCLFAQTIGRITAHLPVYIGRTAKLLCGILSL